MKQPIAIQSSPFDKMPRNTVSVVVGLCPRPMERLTRVMLVVANPGDFGHGRDCVRKIVEHATCDRESLPGLSVAGKTHHDLRSWKEPEAPLRNHSFAASQVSK